MNIEIECLSDYYIAILDEDTKADPNDHWGHTWYPNIDQWCEQAFGLSDTWGAEPVTGWKRMRNKYFFTEENKRSWFMLRWA